jgi:hypothetical protein
LNEGAAHPLHQVQVDALMRLDFNRWAYYFPLEQWESDDMTDFKQLGGPLIVEHRKETVSLSVPSTILVDCLAGKTTLKKHYSDSTGVKLIEDGWRVVGCAFEPGVIEQDLASRVTNPAGSSRQIHLEVDQDLPEALRNALPKNGGISG